MSEKGTESANGLTVEPDALSASESRLRAFTQVLPDLALVLDEDGRFIEVLNPGSPLLYKDVQELQGKLLHDVFPRFLADSYLAVIRKATESEVVQVFEYSLEVMAGLRSFEARVAPIPPEAGGKPLVLWLARDITERKEAEHAVRESQYYFKNLDRISKAISQAADMDDMLFHVVQEILDIFQVDRAWFAYPCDPNSSTWSIPVEVTVPEYPGMFALKTEMPGDDTTSRAFELALENPEPLVFVSTAIMRELEGGALEMLADGQASAFKVVDFEELSETLSRFNIKSQIAIALRPKVGKPWLLGVHQCGYFRRWSDNEVKLFREIAERVTDCLTNFVLFHQLEEDVVKRERIAQALKSSQHYFQSLNQISLAISRGSNIEDMLRYVAEEILAIFQVDRAWFLNPCDPQAPSWRVPVEATVPEFPGVFAGDMEMPWDETSALVFKMALDTRDPLVFVNASDADAHSRAALASGESGAFKVIELKEVADTLKQFDIKSEIVIALRPKAGEPWLMGVHQCAYFRRWSDSEITLFRDIAERITDCLTNFVLFKQLQEDIEQRKRSEERAQGLLEENRALTQRLFSIQEDERRRLSRELHDEFGQLLTAINLHAQAISRQCSDQSPGVRESARIVAEGASQVIHDIRNMVRELRPYAMDDLGLVASLQELVSQIKAHCIDLNIELNVQGEFSGLGEEISITLYRVIQEAMTNVIKHAEAKEMYIALLSTPASASDSGCIELVMEDDGIGVDLNEKVQGMGLMGMRERVLAVGGEFDIANKEAGGVRIRVSIPIGK